MSDPTPEEPPAPATESDKIRDLLTTLRVDGEAAAAAVWGWAERTLGWTRPDPPAA